MSKILRVSMQTQKLTESDLPEKYQNRAGRQLIDIFIFDEVDPADVALRQRLKNLSGRLEDASKELKKAKTR